MTDVDDPRQLPATEGQSVTIKGPISKREEVAMRIQERKRLENENLTFQPALHARQGKQTMSNVEPSGSRFDRLYGDAVKRQCGESKQRNDESQQSFASSVLPVRSRSSSTDRRSTDSGISFSKASSDERMASKESSKDPTITLPAPLKRSKSVDRSQSISASVARLQSSKDQPIEKPDEKKSEKTKSTKTDSVPTFLAPRVRSSSMIFVANPTAATTLSAQDRLRLLAENKNNQLETEPTRQRSRVADGLQSQSKQISVLRSSTSSEVVGTASSRGRDASVKAVAGSRFDTLYKDAMKRKNEDPSLRTKYLERAPFKPTIPCRSRSVSRDRSGIDVTDKQQKTQSSRRLSTPPATDNGVFKVVAPSSRSNSVDRSRGRMSEDQTNQKKPQVKKIRGDQQTLIKSPNATDEIVIGRGVITAASKSASDHDGVQNGNIQLTPCLLVPVVADGSVGNARSQSEDQTVAALRDALVDIVDSVAGVSINGVPLQISATQLETNSTIVPEESNLCDAVERAEDQVPDVSEQTDVDDRIVNESTTDSLPVSIHSTGISSDSRNNEIASGSKSAPFKSPGMRSRSASTDKRRFSIGSAVGATSTGAVTISSVPTRSKDAMLDDAKMKADENRRLKSERDLADARLKALRADRSGSSSNVLRGGTAFAIPNTQDQSVSLKAATSLPEAVVAPVNCTETSSDKLSSPVSIAPSRCSPEGIPTSSTPSSSKSPIAAPINASVRGSSEDTSSRSISSSRTSSAEVTTSSRSGITSGR